MIGNIKLQLPSKFLYLHLSLLFNKFIENSIFPSLLHTLPYHVLNEIRVKPL